jgi:hypothetical protein
MKTLSIGRAKAICTRLTQQLTGYPVLAAFGATGEVRTSFLREARQIEAAKSDLITERRIDQSSYWDIVRLSAFAEFHADAGFSDLRIAHAAEKIASPAMG